MYKKIIAIIIVLALGTLAYPKVKSYFQPKPKTPEIPEEQVMLDNIAATLGILPKLEPSPYWSWVDKNGRVIPLIGTEFFLGTIDTKDIARYKGVDTEHLEKVDAEFLSPIADSTEAVFIQEGYKQNIANSQLKPDGFGSVYFAYEKGDMKCLAMLTKQSDPFGRFFCGKINAKQELLQREFRGLFTMTSKLGQRPPLLLIQKVVGNFALGSYADGSGPGGYTFMAKKVNGKWSVIWRGQDVALCSDMQAHGVPKQIYGECYAGS